MILDTSFIIDVLRGEETALKKLQKLEENNEPLNITSISIFELWSGIEQSVKSKKEKEKIEEVLKGRSVYPLDKLAGELAGLIDGKLCKEGRKVEPQDSMISGIAIREKEKILTCNSKHFKRIADVSTLQVEYLK
jgi:tRNA(fMet)-specific endonuclease VapC